MICVKPRTNDHRPILHIVENLSRAKMLRFFGFGGNNMGGTDVAAAAWPCTNLY